MTAISIDNKIIMIKAFLNNGLDLNSISQVTGISISEIMEIISMYIKK